MKESTICTYGIETVVAVARSLEDVPKALKFKYNLHILLEIPFMVLLTCMKFSKSHSPCCSFLGDPQATILSHLALHQETILHFKELFLFIHKAFSL